MAMPDCTADRLRNLIAGYLGVDASRVTDEAHLSDDLGIEWLDQIELLLIIEDESLASTSQWLSRLFLSRIDATLWVGHRRDYAGGFYFANHGLLPEASH
jgi:hypothetical protein